jgi:hypothetical protein
MPLRSIPTAFELRVRILEIELGQVVPDLDGERDGLLPAEVDDGNVVLAGALEAKPPLAKHGRPRQALVDTYCSIRRRTSRATATCSGERMASYDASERATSAARLTATARARPDLEAVAGPGNA